MEEAAAVVIGGGFYGCVIANHLCGYTPRVILLEKHQDLMQRASQNNQARIHQGYHYPRSLLTALRSRLNFTRFVRDFASCVDDRFEKYYAVASQFSKVTARQFQTFCQRIGAPIHPAPREVCKLFDPQRIEAVFRVVEYGFDAVKLKDQLRNLLERGNVDVRLSACVTRLTPQPDSRILVAYEGAEGPAQLLAGRVINCTYSQINRVLAGSGLPVIPLKHELTEIALVEMPEALRTWGVTVMCGPFFSFMPFPSRGLHTLSHVRYTPHQAWEERTPAGFDPHDHLARWPRTTHFEHMRNDAARYLPLVRDCRHVDSLWEIKTVLPASEQDDSRPILFQSPPGLANLLSVLGSKIDNIYDALAPLDALYLKPEAA